MSTKLHVQNREKVAKCVKYASKTLFFVFVIMTIIDILLFIFQLTQLRCTSS